MLVLSRLKDEVIMIGDDIEIMIVEVRNNGKVRLGVKAPKGVIVDRKEIAIKRRQEGRDAHDKETA